MRIATIDRRTNETDVSLTLNLDGTGVGSIATGLGFLDHMLTHVARHGLCDIELAARGDLHIDEHHTAEDVCICLGQAIDRALGDRRGITRFGHCYAPMDEALTRVVLDLSGRPYCVFEAQFVTPRLGALSTDLVAHMFETIAVHARMTLHAQVLYGRNDHHKAEALFKAFGRALAMAVRIEPRVADVVPSTKGAL